MAVLAVLALLTVLVVLTLRAVLGIGVVGRRRLGHGEV